MLKDDEGHRKVFDLRSPTQLLAKLEWETQQVKDMLAIEDPKAVFAAFNAAATAWHITDWIRTYTRVHPSENNLRIDHKTYRQDVISRCPNLEVCRQISVGWKHRIVDQRNDPNLTAMIMIQVFVKMKDGRIDMNAPPARTKRVPQISSRGSFSNLDALFDDVLRFWREELRRLRFQPEYTI
jgi:hypothetical protein